MIGSRVLGRMGACVVLALGVSACATQGAGRTTSPEQWHRFGSQAAFKAWLATEREARPEIADDLQVMPEPGVPMPVSAPPPPPAPPAAIASQSLDRIEVTGSRVGAAPSGESVTNVQEAGVDEGGIVKRSGDYLVVLRDKVLYTVRLRRDGMDTLELADALPVVMEGDGARVWYDEILVSGSTVILLGFNYGARQDVSELVVFSLDDDGALQRRSRFWVETQDYFDPENYGARLVGDQLLISAQVPFEWHALPEELRWSRRDVDKPRWHSLIDLAEVHVPAFPVRWPVLHALALCPVEDLVHGMLDCQRFGVVGERDYELYVSPSAAYLTLSHPILDKRASVPLSSVFRVPLADMQQPERAVVGGRVQSPLDFSERNGALLVASAAPATQGAGSGYDITRIPMAEFGTAMAQELVLPDWHVELPYPRAQVRFGEDAVWFGPDGRYRWGRGTERPQPMFVQALADAPPERFETNVWPQLLQPVPGGLLVFGSDGDEQGFVLGFAGRQGHGARLLDRFIPGGVELSEMRTHAVNLAGQVDGSLLVGWPVRGREGSESALMFAALASNTLADRGVLDFTDMPELARQSIAWYGQSRVVFLGPRVIGLSGDALIEGRVQQQRVQPVRSAVLERPAALAQ